MIGQQFLSAVRNGREADCFGDCTRWISATRAVLALVFLISSVSASLALSGFDYCARPVSPGCMKAMTRKSSQRAYDLCKKKVDRYVRSTFIYRRCLSQQLENEIRRTNVLVERFRCLKATGQKRIECERSARLRAAEIEAKRPSNAKSPEPGHGARRSETPRRKQR